MRNQHLEKSPLAAKTTIICLAIESFEDCIACTDTAVHASLKRCHSSLTVVIGVW